MSKTYLIETRQTFIIGYAVTMDDDMDPKTIAGKIIAETGHGAEYPIELYQYDAGEVFEQCIPTSNEQIPKIFRAKNDYLSQLNDDEILGRFTMDFRTNKEEE
jgi:hypothetical protein